MKRFMTVACFVSVISLASGAIWPEAALAAVMPTFASLGQLQEGFNSPTRVVADAEGNIYVGNALGDTVVKYDRYKQVVATYRAAPVYAGLAFSSGKDRLCGDEVCGDRLYVAEKTRVAIFDPASDAVSGYLHSGAAEADTFGYVIDMDVDAEGNIYVADAYSNRVHIYDPGGKAVGQFGGQGITPGLMSGMTCLAVNSDRDEIYVGDSGWDNPNYGQGSTRLQVFSLVGQYKRQIMGRTDFGDSALFNFSGLTYDSERLYVFDVMKGRLAVLGLAASGTDVYLGDAPLVSGYGPGEIGQPKDSIFDPTTNRLFVLSGKGAVEIFGVGSAYSDPVAVANTAPGLPVHISPMAEVDVATPTIEFSAAQDNEDNVVSYDVRVVSDAGEVYSVSAAGDTSVQVADVLKENGTYSWQVQAVDEGGLVSGWTAPSSFYVNAVQEAPAAPVLAAPIDGEVLAGADTLFWSEVADPDPNDTVAYRIEVDTDGSFDAPVVSEALTATAAVLGELSQYGDLQVGQDYFWRVVAVDNHGLSAASDAGTFRYDTSLFRVTASMPGASVYLGGNHGYRGTFLGQAPVEVRDFEGGPVPVVVERPGFEPFVTQVRVGPDEKVEVYADLVAGFEPDGFKARPLAAGDAKVSVSGGASPFAVDFNSDGATDLLVGTQAGHVVYYAGTGQDLEFAPAAELALPQLVLGAAPFVVDWNNDGLKDLLLGGADGTVSLLLNSGSQEAPVFPSSRALMASGSILDVGDAAAAAVVDYDGDGAKDLVVGAADGRVLLFANAGSDAAPQLQGGVVLVTAIGQAAPIFNDWDGDGVMEVLLASGTMVDVFSRNEQGGLVRLQSVDIDTRLDKKQGSKGKKRSEGKGRSKDKKRDSADNKAGALGGGLKVFSIDADGRGGKDLIVGNDAGEVLFVKSRGVVPMASLQEALLLKIEEVSALIAGGEQFGRALAATDEQSGSIWLASLCDCVNLSDYRGARGLVDELMARYAFDAEVVRQLGELDSALEQIEK